MTAATVLSPAELRTFLARSRVVPVLRTSTADELRALVEASRVAGFGVVELTATVPGWQGVLQDVVDDSRYADLAIGVGTVVSPEIAREAAALGAHFLVSPFPVPEAVLEDAPPLVQGGLTPGELRAAGAATGVAKLFPAASVGTGHLKAVRDVLPQLEIMPTGGITPATARDWLDAGAIAVGMGTALFKLDDAELAAFVASVGIVG
ncbi:bifunctional 4-hydroxy-2-oxoglutarate aldolase/2-dehydro-3-deoxy-phosphogluconate aldolase [Agromyces protaetiae]|uniref:Bifunctional 4-hydroxy-2-oxoglutarate aldolase/2-dehydro-3-deoxy-phosphogluconate aldolase n=1 Tax=Agromyces protaetiae TaxID=2509455 RepID=A0A4P6FS18_9MICO|nr:bifunctional 4-hydroxy-2-oxoglutarate aldolase/2-dehydro-3-deoxy-phosphogluconate aldolase [Agromyces protaetiae]QAY73328.1 bifunctional 4-hydroxy-2-oxoglutarate aldolase/2-dehydro-3-deoxy-phosphogluconate aldolase [Agromyces protaetiae]